MLFRSLSGSFFFLPHWFLTRFSPLEYNAGNRTGVDSLSSRALILENVAPKSVDLGVRVCVFASNIMQTKFVHIPVLLKT